MASSGASFKVPEDQEQRNIIDKLANFVARNGQKFEELTKEKQKDNPRFGFLFGGEHHRYYKWKVGIEEQQLKFLPPGSLPAPPPAAIAMAIGTMPGGTAPEAHIQAAPQPPSDLNLNDLNGFMKKLMSACTKDNISNGKNWILTNAKSSHHSKHIAQHLLSRLTKGDLSFQEKLHIVYLINDVVHHCARKGAAELQQALGEVVPMVVALTHYGETEERQEKLNKVRKIWKSNNFFDTSVTKKLDDPDQTYLDHEKEKAREEQEKQQQQQQQQQQASQPALPPPQSDVYGFAPPPSVSVAVAGNYQYPPSWQPPQQPFNYQSFGQQQHQQQQAPPFSQPYTPFPFPYQGHPQGMPSDGPPPQHQQQQNPRDKASDGTPSIDNDEDYNQQELTSQDDLSEHHPAGPGFQPMHGHQMPHGGYHGRGPPPFHGRPPPQHQGGPPRQQGFYQGRPPPPQDFGSHVGFSNQRFAPPRQRFDGPQVQQFDYGHQRPGGFNEGTGPSGGGGPPQPLSFDYNHGRSEGAPAMHPEPPPRDPTLPHAPYFDLPAGLVVPLVKMWDCEYKPIDPQDLRLPVPQPPSERLLAAVEAFYSPPSHDRPRDSQGWEKNGFFEYFKEKLSFIKGKPRNIASVHRSPSPLPALKRGRSRSRSRSRSMSPRRRHGDDKNGRRSRSPARHRSPSPSRRSRSRSRSPRRSMSRSPRRSARSRSRSYSRSPVRRRSISPRRSPTPPAGFVMYEAKSLDSKIEESNVGHQLLKKMGWSGKGLGRAGQGIEAPIKGGDIREKSDMYKGIGVDLNDPFEQYRKNRSYTYTRHHAERAEIKKEQAERIAKEERKAGRGK